MFTGIAYDWSGARVVAGSAVTRMNGTWFDTAMIVGTRLVDNQIVILLIAAAAALTLLKGSNAVRAMTTTITLAMAYVLTTAIVLVVNSLAALAHPMRSTDVAAALHQPTDDVSFLGGLAARGGMLVAILWPYLPLRWRIVGGLFVSGIAGWQIVVTTGFPVDVMAGVLVCTVIGGLAGSNAQPAERVKRGGVRN